MNRFITLCYCLILCSCNGLFAQERAGLLDRKINIETENGTLGDYLSVIVAHGISLSYSNNQLRLSTKTNVKKGQYKIRQLLQLILAKEAIQFIEQGNKIVLYPSKVKPGQNFRLSGFVYVGNSSEAVPSANISIVANHIRISANDYGFYSMQLSAGAYIIEISHIGYASQTDTITLNDNMVLDFRLKAGLVLPELKVVMNNGNPFKDIHAVDLKENLNLPFTLGQQDPLKAIQFKAGVSGGMAGSNMNVRGGNSDQNLVLLDGAPVYNYNHFTGLLSIFNADAVKHIDFYKGSFPSRYEGRLSSVIDVKTKEGNMQEYHGAVNVGLLTNSAMIEGPIIRDKVSFMASARRSWIDGLVRLVDNDDSGFKYYLYDVNLKLNYKVDSTSRIYLSSYLGSDLFNLGLNDENKPSFSLKWGNMIVSARWNKVHNSKLFQNSTLLFSVFNNRLNDGEPDGEEQFNRIVDVGIDNDLTYQWSNNLRSNAGFRVNLARFSSPALGPGSETPIIETQKSAHLKFYIDNDIAVSDQVKLNAGLHYTSFLVRNKTYDSFQPRTRLSFNANPANQFYAAYSFMAQFYHQISLGAISIPNEFRAPSNANLPPEQAVIYELGYLRSFSSYGGISIELYRKNFKDILMYRLQNNYMQGEVSSIANNNKLITGKGFSQGLEIEYKQRFNWLLLQTNYTLSKTIFSFAEINNGKPFRAPTDLRNQVTCVVLINPGKKWSASALFNYSTGRLITIPRYTLPDLDDVLAGKKEIENYYFYAAEPNNYKLSDNYGVDLGAVYTKTYKAKRQGILRFGINNVIGNPSPLLVNTSLESNQFDINQVKSPKFIPYVGYSYKF